MFTQSGFPRARILRYSTRRTVRRALHELRTRTVTAGSRSAGTTSRREAPRGSPPFGGRGTVGLLAVLGLIVGLPAGLHAQGATLPAPSPDGRHLAFVSTRDGNPEIYVLDTHDGDVTRVTRHDGTDEHPSWSPDGERLAFVSDRDGGRRVWISGPAASEPRPVTPSGTPVMNPAWSPDGRWIAVAAGSFPDLDLWLYPSDDGDEPVRLTEGPAADYWPAWSPDGQRMAFVRLVIDREARRPVLERSGIGLLDVDGGDHELIAPDVAGVNEAPAFSPDGEWVAYHSRRDEDFDLLRTRPDGSQVTPLREGDTVDEVPVWAGTNRLYFQTRTEDGWQIWSMAVDGSDARPVVVR